MAKLILSLDDVVLEDIPLTKERTTIGRKPYNDIHIDNLAVSGEHAVIVTVMNDCIVEDLGSTNGTLVNGVLAKRHVLRNNDVIGLGKYTLRFEGLAAGHAPAPSDYEKTMVSRPGSAKAPAGQPAAGRPGAPAGPTAGPPHAPPHSPSAIPVPRRTRAHASGPAHVASDASVQASVHAAAAAHSVARAAAAVSGASGIVRILSGPRAGRDLKLHKPLTTLGKPGKQVATVTLRPQGYFIAHIEGPPTTVNGRPIGAAPQPLKDGDTFEIADVRMEFLLRDEAVDAPPSQLWKVVLMLIGIVIAAYVIYRMRG